MSKDGKFWFDHDYHARNDDKILELRAEFGAEGYGIFWMIIETMADSETASINYSLIGGLSHGYGVAKGRLSEIIDFCVSIGLFFKEDGKITSQRIDNHKKYRKSCSVDGKKGAEKRWGGYSHPKATLKPPNSNNITIHNNTNTDNTGNKPEPMTEKEFREFSEKMKNDKLFTEPLFSAGLKKEHLAKWILRFHVQIVGDDKLNKDYGEYRKHFKNWLNKQDYLNPPPALPALDKGKQNGQTAASYIKKESEVDFDKYKK